VLVVSGRPQLLDPAQFDGVESVVASWLPGTEGAGVAQPLFGDRPYTGRLSVTWPRTMAQEPINVGDAVYDPQYAYGWGLRTDSGRARLAAVRDVLSQQARSHRGGWGDAYQIRQAIAALDRATAPGGWAADGSVKNPIGVLAALSTATRALEGVRGDVSAQFDPIVSVARDVVQARLIATPASAATASAAAQTAAAEHDLLAGQPTRAIQRFSGAWQLLG
jgi:beta-glucosidase